jgi:hypothetical protein
MFVLQVYHTHDDINEASLDFLVQFLVKTKGRAFCEILNQMNEYLKNM